MLCCSALSGIELRNGLVRAASKLPLLKVVMLPGLLCVLREVVVAEPGFMRV